MASPDHPRLSFGVELEFLVAYIPQSWDESALEDSPNMAKAIRGHELPLCREDIAEAINALGVNDEGDRNRVFDHGEEAAWVVTDDASLALPHGLMMYSEPYLGVMWDAIEVKSPALWADADDDDDDDDDNNNNESWAQISQVCEALSDRFWIITPESAGLHVHVGAGQAYMSLRNLRRTAALLLAADPILVQLHPGHRKANGFCRSNRVYAAVAQGRTTATAQDESVLVPPRARDHHQQQQQQQGEADDDVEGEGDLLAHLRHVPAVPDFSLQSAPFSSLAGHNTSSTFTREIPRGALPGYPYAADAHVLSGAEWEEAYEAPRPRDMRFCIKELTQASRRGVLTLLMQTACIGPRNRLAYSFANFNEMRHAQEERKRTIEFRQATGSVDAAEVVAFGQAYVGLCRFALDATHAHFWHVVNRCIDGDPLRVPHSERQRLLAFDVFDLLTLMGLEDDAARLQGVILTRPVQPQPQPQPRPQPHF